MRKDYRTVVDITEVQEKKYLLDINHNLKIQDMILECMSSYQLHQLLNHKKIYQYLYLQAMNALYQTKSYDELEYHLIMMNHLFKEKTFYKIKKDLFEKITKKNITLDEYCIIRHLIDMKHLHFEYVILLLKNQYHVETIECARICFLENQPQLAYEFLKELDECSNEAMLDLLRSYSLRDYLSLIKHYSKTQKSLVMQSTY